MDESQKLQAKAAVAGLYDGLSEWNGISKTDPALKAMQGYTLGYFAGTGIRWLAIYFGLTVASGAI